MIWITPSAKGKATETLEKRLWDADDQLGANTGLKAHEYFGPILGLIFLRFSKVITLVKRTQELRWTRNLLLPRLLSRQDDFGGN